MINVRNATLEDATMQYRMEAVLRKYAPEKKIIHYAAYQAEVKAVGDTLQYKEEISGMWDIERYVNLLMGEIPRLSDDENGYGPKGRDFLVHVDVSTYGNHSSYDRNDIESPDRRNIWNKRLIWKHG